MAYVRITALFMGIFYRTTVSDCLKMNSSYNCVASTFGTHAVHSSILEFNK